MRRHRLILHELRDCGGAYSSFHSSSVDALPPSDDALEDEKLRFYMMKKARQEALARARRIARLRRLARMDFSLTGPLGFAGGDWVAGATFRPVGGSARS